VQELRGRRALGGVVCIRVEVIVVVAVSSMTISFKVPVVAVLVVVVSPVTVTIVRSSRGAVGGTAPCSVPLPIVPPVVLPDGSRTRHACVTAVPPVSIAVSLWGSTA
jgi:hypothetical protein